MTNRAQSNPWLATRSRTGREYDAPYEARAAAGIDIHGEANFIRQLLAEKFKQLVPTALRVLDAGCGTGRTGIELARHGFQVVGVDLDEEMLKQARKKAPLLDWRQADLSTVELGTTFDCIVMAGNVMIFVTPGTEAAVLANMEGHLAPGGLLVAAFELSPPAWSKLTLAYYDQLAHAAGLSLFERWASWDRDPWYPHSQYAVSVHAKILSEALQEAQRIEARNNADNSWVSRAEMKARLAKRGVDVGSSL